MYSRQGPSQGSVPRHAVSSKFIMNFYSLFHFLAFHYNPGWRRQWITITVVSVTMGNRELGYNTDVHTIQAQVTSFSVMCMKVLCTAGGNYCRGHSAAAILSSFSKSIWRACPHVELSLSVVARTHLGRVRMALTADTEAMCFSSLPIILFFTRCNEPSI